MSIKIKFGDVEIDGLEDAGDALRALRILKGDNPSPSTAKEPPAPISAPPAGVQGELPLAAEEVEKIPVTAEWISKKFGSSLSSVSRWLKFLAVDTLGTDGKTTLYSLRDFERKLYRHCGISPEARWIDASDDKQQWYRYRDISRNKKVRDVNVDVLWQKLYSLFTDGCAMGLYFPHSSDNKKPGTIYYEKSYVEDVIVKLGGTIEGGTL